MEQNTAMVAFGYGKNESARRCSCAGPYLPGRWFEPLEPRTLLSGSTLSADGILTIVGTDKADEIVIYRKRRDDRALVVYGQAVQMPGDLFAPEEFGAEFPFAQVRAIRICGMGGDDVIRVVNSPTLPSPAWNPDELDDYGRLDIPVTIDGGAGDDELSSQSDADDVIIGGPGVDHSYVVDGRDRFAVETVTNYRDVRTWVDAGGTLRAEFGTFAWNGSEDELFADPWQVPNRSGAYAGPNAPTFDVEEEEEDGVTDPDDGLVPELDGDDGDNPADVPDEEDTAVAPLPQASPFAVLSFGSDSSERSVWDEGEFQDAFEL